MKEEKESGIELPPKQEYNGTRNGNTKPNEQLTFSQKLKKLKNNFPYYVKSFFAFFTVEPFLLCFVLPNVISAVTVQKLNLEKACRADLNYTEEICNKVISGIADDNITTNALNEASIMNAAMTAWKQPLQSGIPAIMILFVGAWSDRTGNRKALMLIPLIGELISAIGLMLATYFFLEWPLWVTALIEALPPAICGGLSIALMGSYSFIADVTSIENRTFRLGIVAVIVTLAVPIGSALSGILTETIGYYGIFGSNVVMFVIGFIHTYFRVKNVKNVDSEGSFLDKLKLFFHPKNVWDTISLVVMSRGKLLAQILLVICAHIVIVGPVFGEGGLQYFYVVKKYNMDVLDFSFFLTYSTVMGLVGTAIAVTLFSKLLKFHDAILGMIATTCKVVSSFVYALAPTRNWFYSAPAFDIFGNSGVTAIRSLGTKVVEADQVGRMCSLIGFVEAIVPVIYTPIYSNVYISTIESFSGMFYVLGGIMTIPAFFIFIALYVMHRRQQRDVVTNPEAKEAYARDNDVTAF